MSLIEPALRKCEKPDCFRQVKEGVAYCCTACSVAAAGKFEIHTHSESCDERAAERGPWLTGVERARRDAEEWRARRQRRDPWAHVSLTSDPLAGGW